MTTLRHLPGLSLAFTLSHEVLTAANRRSKICVVNGREPGTRVVRWAGLAEGKTEAMQAISSASPARLSRARPMSSAAPATPWLTVIMPVYRGEQWLEASLQSLAAQADEGIELLVIDAARTKPRPRSSRASPVASTCASSRTVCCLPGRPRPTSASSSPAPSISAGCTMTTSGCPAAWRRCAAGSSGRPRRR